MKKSINFFQKGVISLVVFMFFTIPSMDVYSSIGNYKSSSLAITANKNYERYIGEKKRINYIAAACLATGAIVLSAALVVCLVANNINIAQGDIQNQNIGNITNPMNTFEENYLRHDFSKFDN